MPVSRAPSPDTSPANVARVLRDLLAQIDRMAPTLEEYDYTPEECAGKALADALDAHKGPLQPQNAEKTPQTPNAAHGDPFPTYYDRAVMSDD